MGRRAGRLLVTAFLFLAGAAAAAAASFPPELRFRSVSTDRVTVRSVVVTELPDEARDAKSWRPRTSAATA